MEHIPVVFLCNYLDPKNLKHIPNSKMYVIREL